MRKFFQGAAFVALLAWSAPAAAGGVPVIDVAAIAQMVAQFEEMKRAYEQRVEQITALADQLETMRAELETAQTQLASLTGARGISEILNAAEDRYGRETVADFRSLVDAAGAGAELLEAAGALGPRVERLRETYDLTSFAALLESEKPRDRAISEHLGVGVATVVAAEDGFERANAAMDRIDALIAGIDANADLKASLDYNTRVQAEVAVLLVELLRVQSADAAATGAAALSEARDAAAARKLGVWSDANAGETE